MDRHFIALKATDDQAAAVAAFREYDRSALPVTDTAGMLIGIVTVDDVLDVAEDEATKDIQRIGGSEALDEPYMDIAFSTMIRKRGHSIRVAKSAMNVDSSFETSSVARTSVSAMTSSRRTVCPNMVLATCATARP